MGRGRYASAAKTAVVLPCGGKRCSRLYRPWGQCTGNLVTTQRPTGIRLHNALGFSAIVGIRPKLYCGLPDTLNGPRRQLFGLAVRPM